MYMNNSKWNGFNNEKEPKYIFANLKNVGKLKKGKYVQWLEKYLESVVGEGGVSWIIYTKIFIKIKTSLPNVEFNKIFNQSPSPLEVIFTLQCLLNHGTSKVIFPPSIG